VIKPQGAKAPKCLGLSARKSTNTKHKLVLITGLRQFSRPKKRAENQTSILIVDVVRLRCAIAQPSTAIRVARKKTRRLA